LRGFENLALGGSGPNSRGRAQNEKKENPRAQIHLDPISRLILDSV
jgi:hypothetical protein